MANNNVTINNYGMSEVVCNNHENAIHDFLSFFFLSFAFGVDQNFKKSDVRDINVL